jgi:hypothetical protein
MRQRVEAPFPRHRSMLPPNQTSSYSLSHLSLLHRSSLEGSLLVGDKFQLADSLGLSEVAHSNPRTVVFDKYNNKSMDSPRERMLE